MEHDLRKVFNYEVERFRNALVSCAHKNEWDIFKKNAGKLFDYVESIEVSEIERRFFRISKLIMAILFIMLLFVLRMNHEMYAQFARIREVVLLSAISVCSFELYFFFNFRMFVQGKMSCYNKRREQFIRDIERDFREIEL